MNSSPFLLLAMTMVSASVLGNPLIPVSVRHPEAAAGVTGGAASMHGVFGGSSRQVLFLSAASDLATNDVNGAVLDLFQRDLDLGRTTLISTNSAGTSGPGQVWDFSVAADGRRVAFTWATDETSLGDTNGVTDIYWRDLETGAVALVSRRHGAPGAANARSRAPRMSADGRWIVFESEASDLVENPDVLGRPGVFLHDTLIGTSEWISRPPAGSVEDPPDPEAFAGEPAISADGSVVVFLSNLAILAPIEGLGTTALVWTRGGTGLRRVRLPGTPPAPLAVPLGINALALSADGRVLAFPVPAGGLTDGLAGVWRMDLITGDLAPISGGLPISVETLVEGPVVSADGGTLAFTVDSGADPDQGLAHQIRIWKAGSGMHTLKSLQDAGSAAVEDPSGSLSPVLSADGGQILFLSDAAIPEAGVPVAGVLQWFHRELATGVTRTLSGDPEAIGPGFSPDGRHVILEEGTPVLAAGDRNGEADLVVVSLADGVRTVVSLAAVSGRTASGGSTTGVGLSDDGWMLAYLSLASDLVTAPDDPGRSRDVFAFDRTTGANRLLSSGPDGAATGGATESVLSRNGRFLADIPADADGRPGSNLVCIHLETGVRELVTAVDGGTNSLAGWATEPRISADGRRVGFRLSPTREHVADSALYLRDLDTRRTWPINPPALTGRPRPQGRRLQLAADARLALFEEARGEWFLVRFAGDAFVEVQRFQANNAWMGADGRTVVILRLGAGIRPPGLSLRVLPSPTEVFLLPPSAFPISDVQIAAQGGVMTYVRRQDPAMGTPPQVWALPVATHVEELVSRSPAGVPGSADSRGPQISADGRFITYRTASPELTGERTGSSWPQVVVTDRYTGTTRVLSRAADGDPGNSLSTQPQISGDGRWVAFTTFADNLLPGDHNGLGDVALARVEASLPDDSDADGLADVWERDHFGSLDAAASADPDGDGQSNAAEQEARTLPWHPDSVLRLQITSTGAAGEIRWSGSAGVRYRLEQTPELNAAGSWAPVGDPVIGHTGEIRRPLPSSIAGGFLRLMAAASE